MHRAGHQGGRVLWLVQEGLRGDGSHQVSEGRVVDTECDHSELRYNNKSVVRFLSLARVKFCPESFPAGAWRTDTSGERFVKTNNGLIYEGHKVWARLSSCDLTNTLAGGSGGGGSGAYRSPGAAGGGGLL